MHVLWVFLLWLMFGGDPRRSYSPDMAPLTLILNSVFKLIFKKIFHSQNPCRAFYCGKLVPVNHPPSENYKFYTIETFHGLSLALWWNHSFASPNLWASRTLLPLAPSSSCPPSRSGGGAVTLNCSSGFIENNLWGNLYEPAILQLIQNYKL